MADHRAEGFTREDALAAVQAGWASLVREVMDAAHAARENGATVLVTSVFRHLGALHVYFTASTAEASARLWRIAADVERRSYDTCELCGAAGELHDLDRVRCAACWRIERATASRR